MTKKPLNLHLNKVHMTQEVSTYILENNFIAFVKYTGRDTRLYLWVFLRHLNTTEIFIVLSYYVKLYFLSGRSHNFYII